MEKSNPLWNLHSEIEACKWTSQTANGWQKNTTISVWNHPITIIIYFTACSLTWHCKIPMFFLGTSLKSSSVHLAMWKRWAGTLPVIRTPGTPQKRGPRYIPVLDQGSVSKPLFLTTYLKTHNLTSQHLSLEQVFEQWKQAWYLPGYLGYIEDYK